MADAIRYDYRRYLEAKRSVDDRSINQHVLASLRAQIDRSRPQRVLEIGGGTGTMVRRTLDQDLLGPVHYTLVDRDDDSLQAFQSKTRDDAKVAGYDLRLVHADISDFLSTDDTLYDLVIANAVLDLLDVPSLLEQLAPRCRRDALLWFTINFDGESCFLPEHSHDELIWHAYHQSMNRAPGRRYAGRALLESLRSSGATLLAVGSSDWIVHPCGQRYPQDEGYFLHHIVETIDSELRAEAPVPTQVFRDWIACRHQDIQDAKLIYIAHQIDVLSSIAATEASNDS